MKNDYTTRSVEYRDINGRHIAYLGRLGQCVMAARAEILTGKRSAEELIASISCMASVTTDETVQAELVAARMGVALAQQTPATAVDGDDYYVGAVRAAQVYEHGICPRPAPPQPRSDPADRCRHGVLLSAECRDCDL